MLSAFHDANKVLENSEQKMDISLQVRLQKHN